jgi:hypothetical protein
LPARRAGCCAYKKDSDRGTRFSRCPTMIGKSQTPAPRAADLAPESKACVPKIAPATRTSAIEKNYAFSQSADRPLVGSLGAHVRLQPGRCNRARNHDLDPQGIPGPRPAADMRHRREWSQRHHSKQPDPAGPGAGMDSTATARARQPAAYAHGQRVWSRAARCRGRRRREPSRDAQYRSPDARLAWPPSAHAREREMHSRAHTCTRDQRIKAIAVSDSRTCGAEAQRCSIFA